MFKKCTLLWREAHFQVEMLKAHMLGPLLKDVVLRGRRQGRPHLARSEQKKWRFCSISKNDGRRGTFQEDLQRCIWRGFAVQETCSSEMLGGQGADVLKGVAWWSIRSSGFLRRFCASGGSTWYDLGITCSTSHRSNGKIAKRIGTRPALNFPCLKEVSQNCFVFDVVTFENWGRLAKLIRFLDFVKFKKLRKSRRIAALLMLSSSKIEEV